MRICTRLGVRMMSTNFEDRNYYVNIRKAILSGYFMQVGGAGGEAARRGGVCLCGWGSACSEGQGVCWGQPGR